MASVICKGKKVDGERCSKPVKSGSYCHLHIDQHDGKKTKKKSSANKTQRTITITFGDQAENHKGMQMIGELAEEGFTLADLKAAKALFEAKDCKCELIKLHKDIDEEVKLDKAAILIVRQGVNALLASKGKDEDDLYAEQKALDWDSKAFMYGRVVNKKARYNLCFGKKAQKPDYEEGKGRVIAFKDVECTNIIRKKLKKFVGEKAASLVAEGNYYYDITQCGIGFHGDSERKKVIALRLGASMSLHYQWYQNSKPLGERIKIKLHHGDLYIMNEKATGFDWKKKKIPTLRHAAGSAKYVK